MANGGGLMSIAASENLNPLEKFALGFLGTAEQNQRKRYEEEAKFVREKTATIKDRIQQQSTLFNGMKADTKAQIEALLAVAPGLGQSSILGILRGGKDNVEQALKDMRKDKAVNQADMSKAGRNVLIEVDGEMRPAGPGIYAPRSKSIDTAELAGRLYRRPSRQPSPEQEETDFAQLVASFFGAPTDTESLMNQARKNALDVRGYGTGIQGGGMDRAIGLQEFFASGGTASQLEQSSPGITVQTMQPEKPAEIDTARQAIGTYAAGLKKDADQLPKQLKLLKPLDDKIKAGTATKSEVQSAIDLKTEILKNERASLVLNKIISNQTKFLDDFSQGLTSIPRTEDFLEKYTGSAGVKNMPFFEFERQELDELLRILSRARITARKEFEQLNP